MNETRFIPASAGNTRSIFSGRIKRPVYPRWRGEHAPPPVRLAVSCGLSPLARGTHARHRCQSLRYRFIPAGAGNTSLPLRHRRGSPVYPRWRGEHLLRVLALTNIHGLSPLARGTRDGGCSAGKIGRFIPAGAGNTSRKKARLPRMPVYPRWRGEHKLIYPPLIPHCGLSPLARGTRLKVNELTKDERFIPAGAGNTASTTSVISTRPVYPRWRGEHPDAGTEETGYPGLSPLARGTPIEP